MRNTLLIGIGNVDRGDDGVGVRVAQKISKNKPAGVVVLETRGEGLDLMDAWEGFDHVIVVDAAQTRNSPGVVHRFDAKEKPLPANLFSSSTHAFGLGQMVEMARALGKLPLHLTLFAIEGKNWTLGDSLSEEASFGAEEVIQKIKEELTCMK